METLSFEGSKKITGGLYWTCTKKNHNSWYKNTFVSATHENQGISKANAYDHERKLSHWGCTRQH